MVVTCELPMLSIGVTQDRVATPSMCTVQAPHSAAPQPNLVPVMPSTSRRTQSNGVSPSTSALCAVPLTLMLKAMLGSPFDFLDWRPYGPRQCSTKLRSVKLFSSRARRHNVQVGSRRPPDGGS